MTKQQFIQRLKESSLDKYLDRFESILRNTIRIYLSKRKEGEIFVGASRIGGKPDLPADIEWPAENNDKPLAFIAQLNLKEISPLDSDRLLPESGILYFFYRTEQDAWGFDPKDKDKFRVIYYDGTIDKLQRQEPPKSLPKRGQFSPNEVRFAQEVSLPSWQSDLLNFLTQEEQDKFIDIFESGENINKILGYADEVQGEMELECELVTNGLYCGDQTGYKDSRREELEKNKDDWRLLLQVDSNDEAGMMWGDVGRIYFWIKKIDLQKKRFENAWFILQCS